MQNQPNPQVMTSMSFDGQRRQRKTFFAIGLMKVTNVRIYEGMGRKDLISVEAYVGKQADGVHIAATGYHFLEEFEVAKYALDLLRSAYKNEAIFVSKDTEVVLTLLHVGVAERMQRRLCGVFE